MAGNLSAYSIPITALFDSGASHCFISSRVVAMHSLPHKDLGYQWEISTGNGVIVTNKVCKSCLVGVCGRTLEADLFMISTGDYNMILGITWLSKHHAVIDCCNMTVTFRTPGQPEFQFKGESKL
jgi:hypothetical protein